MIEKMYTGERTFNIISGILETNRLLMRITPKIPSVINPQINGILSWGLSVTSNLLEKRIPVLKDKKYKIFFIFSFPWIQYFLSLFSS